MSPKSWTRRTRFIRGFLFTALTLFAAHSVYAQSTPDFGSTTVANQFLPLGATFGGSGNLQALTLPAATGGDAPVTYTLQPTVAGMTFDSATRAWSGTPSTAMASTTLTYTATDTDGGFDTLTYSVLVQEATIGFERTSFQEREDAEIIQVCAEMTVPASGFALPPDAAAYISMRTAIRSGDTAEAADFTALDETLMFNHGNRERCALARITQDTVRESAEVFALTLTVDESRSNFNVNLSPDTASVTVEDDDVIEVGFGASAYTATEGTPLAFTVVINDPPAGQAIDRGDFAISVSTMAGTATAGSDFTALSDVRVGPLGDSNRVWNGSVTILDDSAAEGAETFTLQLSDFVPGEMGPVGIRLSTSSSTPSTVTVTIRRSDSPGVTFTPSELTVTEGSTSAYTAALDLQPSMGDVTVTPSSGDTGEATLSPAELVFTTANWNTAQTVTVFSIFDADADDETVTLSHTVAGDGNYASVTADNVVATIGDVGTSAVRVGGMESEAENAGMVSFRVFTGGAAPSSPVIVQCTVGPTDDPDDDDAEAGDFRVNSGATTPAPAYPSSAPIALTASNWNTAQNCTFFLFDDNRPEGDEQFSVTLTALSGSPNILPSTAEGTIYRDDIRIGFVRTAYTVGESAGTQQVCIGSAQQLEPGGRVEFGLSFSTRAGTATGGGTDYVDITNASTLSFTLTDQRQQHCFDVTIVDDATAEGTENMFIDVAPLPGEILRGVTVTPSQATITITDGEISADIANAGDDADPATAGFQVQAGDTAAFRVTLSAPLSDLVTLTYAVTLDGLTSSDYTDQTGAANSMLSFAGGVTEALVSLALNDGVSAGNTLTVTISAPQAGGNSADAITLGTASADALTAASTAAVNVSPTRLVLTEGATAQYTLALNTQPASEVVITPASSDANTVTVPAASLTFTMTNWNTPQTVTVTGVTDTDNADDSASVTHTAAQSGGGGYDALAVAHVEVTVRDNLMISPAALSVAEGASATYTVALGVAPTGGDVAVTPVATGGASAIQVAGTTLVFTPTDWSTPRTVTVTALSDDDFADETATIRHAVISTASNYAAIDAGGVVVTVEDDETDATPYFGTGVSVPDQTLYSGRASRLELPRAAGGDGALTYELAGLPDNLGLTYDAAAFTLGGTPAMTLPTTALTYSATDEDGSSAQLTFDLEVNARSVVNVGFLRDDHEFVEDTRATPAVFLRTLGSFGGGELIVAVEPFLRPGDNAVQGVHYNPPPNPLVRLTSATITTANFGIIDNRRIGPARTFGMRLRVVSASENLEVQVGGAGIFTETEVAILDNEFSQFFFSSGGRTSGSGDSSFALSVREGETVIYTLRPQLEPEAATEMVFTLNTPSPSPVSASATSLTFTSADWNTPQAVTLTALEDADMDTDTATIRHTLTVTGTGTAGTNSKDLVVTVTDNDVPGYIVSTTALTLREGGASVPYTIRLQVAPTGNVEVRVTALNIMDIIFNTLSLTFTPANWNTPQTVSVSADEEMGANADTTTDTGSIRHSVTATGTNYAGVSAPPDIPLTVLDNDGPAVLFSPNPLNANEGAATAVSVRLQVAPDAQTVLRGTVAPSGSLTLSSTELTFSTTNWNTAQTVTLTVATDDDPDDSAASVTYTATNASGNYMNVAATLQVTVTDTQSAPDFGAATVADQFFPLGATFGGSGNLQPLTLPQAVGGDAPVTYTLQPTIAGLTFDAASRVWSGTPSAATASPVTMTYTATDNGGQTDSLTYSVSIQEVTIGFRSATYLEREDVGGIQVCADMTVPATGTMLPSGSTAQVTLGSNIRGTDTAEVSDFTAVSASLVFNSGNRQGCAVVGITDDQVREDSESFALTLTLDAPNSNFDVNLDPGTATVTIEDNDEIEVRFRASAYPAMEGDTLTVTVEISNPPAGQAIERGDFSVGVSTLEDTAMAGMDFTALSNMAVSLGDSNRSRDIEVTIIDDTDEEEDETFSLQLAFVPGQTQPPNTRFVTPTSATVTIEANDVPGVTFEPAALSVDEGAYNTYTARLSAEPNTGDVVVTPGSRNSAAATVSGALTFTTSNWNTPQTVTVAGLFDFDSTDDTVMIGHTVTGDGNYFGLSVGNVRVTIVDVGTGVTFAPAALSVNEGAYNTYTARLDAEPNAGNVVVTPGSRNSAVATVSGALTFTTSNWNTPQTVTVSSLFDFDLTDGTAMIGHTVAGDGNYANLSVGNVRVTIVDVGTGVTFAPAALSVDEGAYNTYTARLDAEPNAGNVVVTPGSRNSAVATVSGALTFTAANWNTPQTVTVTGVSDDDAVDEPVTIIHAVAGGGNYANLTVGEVVVMVDDDETVGVTVAPTTLALIEGASAHYTLYLHSQPAGRRTVTITPSINIPGVVTLSPAGPLTFGPDNWSVAQTVTVTGIDDSDNDTSSATISHAVAGTDYNGLTVDDVDKVRVTVEERMDDELQALNETILPEVARAVVVHQLDTIAERTGLAGAPGALPSFNLNGQSSFAGLAATNAQALAGGDLDMKKTLRDMDFVMPLAAGGGSGDTGGTMALWGGSEYRDFSGEDGDTEWDGDLFSMHLGFDGRVRDGLLAGVMLSYSDSESEYEYLEDGRAKKGDYELDMTSLNQYLNWDLSGGAFWVTAGYGEGDLEITPDDADITASSSDVNMISIGAGGNRRLLKQNRRELHVKADAFFTRADVEGNSVNINPLEMDASRLRVALESRHPRPLSGGLHLTPAFEIGLRHDGGDGQTGSGVEVGGSLSYRDAPLGLTMEARARALLGHSGDHRGWGIGGFARMEAGRDGQGLSLSLSPAYGNTDGKMEKLWKDGVRDSADENPLKARLDAQVGYGVPARMRLPVSGDGMLTPYSALSWGEDKQKYRFGLRWENGRRFGLDLSARRVDEDHKDSNHALILDGKLSF